MSVKWDQRTLSWAGNVLTQNFADFLLFGFHTQKAPKDQDLNAFAKIEGDVISAQLGWINLVVTMLTILKTYCL